MSISTRHLVITSDYLEDLLAAREPSGPLVGRAADGGMVLQLGTGLSGESAELPGGWWRSAEGLEEALPGLAAGSLAAYLEPEPHFFSVTEEHRVEPVTFETVRLYTDYYNRSQGLFDRSVLNSKKVAVVGLGTGGSFIAAELARAGVGHFILIDFDRLQAHNLARHVCGLADLGRFKTDALRDYLYNASPVVKVDTHCLDITADPLLLPDILAGCDLIIGATDSEEAKMKLNRAAWKLAIPAIYGAAYELGFGGDIFLAEPPAGACYACFRQQTEELFGEYPHEPIQSYGKERPQPALGLDVHFIGLIAARMALTVLLRDDPESRFEEFPANWVLWGTQVQPGWLFERPLQSDFVQIEPDPCCPVCHEEEYNRQMLGMSAAEINAEASELLKSLTSYNG
ncbi:MAG TPA: ThiF family adenylyltransferase [Chloroflexia bacterium]|nr:ThiF family adenylyltransferase [Chloroflexia bacterium]